MIDKKKQSLVSIITPSYNAMKFIGETYSSIKKQTFSEWEWLITDDCSNDGTWEYICKLSEGDSRIKPRRNNQNSGAAVSRNNSIERAKGDFIAFLDSDDIWLPEKLYQHVNFMVTHKVNLSFTPYSLIDEIGEDLNRVIDIKKIGEFTYRDMLIKKATMGCCTVVVRKSAFVDLNMPLIRAGQDYAFWLKLLKTGHNAVIFPKILSKYRIVSNSLSRNKLKKAAKIWQVYRRIEQLSFSSSIYVFLHYAVRALFKLN